MEVFLNSQIIHRGTSFEIAAVKTLQIIPYIIDDSGVNQFIKSIHEENKQSRVTTKKEVQIRKVSKKRRKNYEIHLASLSVNKGLYNGSEI
ncbi:unnamed protein product [Allacma fusca]|uniref:Uncharacterized protein n=1 Tax=Allacma fusca TaxID=39272 RepID=A0A8J2Q609_9HEXA|nr:unnamed protein product [Allacma fusca]